MEYRHPVQGWTMPLPVEDVDRAPEVFYVAGARLERADLLPQSREDALALLVGRTLQREEEPGAWEYLPQHRRDYWVGRGRLIVGTLNREGVLA